MNCKKVIPAILGRLRRAGDCAEGRLVHIKKLMCTKAAAKNRAGMTVFFMQHCKNSFCNGFGNRRAWMRGLPSASQAAGDLLVFVLRFALAVLAGVVANAVWYLLIDGLVTHSKHLGSPVSFSEEGEPSLGAAFRFS